MTESPVKKKELKKLHAALGIQKPVQPAKQSSKALPNEILKRAKPKVESVPAEAKPDNSFLWLAGFAALAILTFLIATILGLG